MGRSLSRWELEVYDHVPHDVATRARLYRARRLPPGTHAMTLGRRVLLRTGHEDNRQLLAHELVHVAQFADRGRMRFLARYLADYLGNLLRLRRHREAYLAIPDEIAARAGAGAWVGAHPDLLDGR